MSCKVLVVDDEAQLRDLFSDLLKKENFTVKCASSGEEALDIIGKEDFEVVLLDIRMSGISGLEALKKIKELKPNMIVILITGFGYDEDLITKSKEYGCAGYIGKNMPISRILSSFKLFIKTAKEKAK
ncbi:MAG: two-component system response regulator [Candidatus Omnitrophica bacterium CG08_land_8_20_14_0_20_41_16]|uniref:Two-component system response regulator n=1 Tax=Candidatus Sherwoodlollariibacterium unditelluris TaxID=1974757 RepID=A0A2G9YMS0_9BACT|nr:MAG: two-component system response regulator [Candidatus Omnitrophica bacterium CG23_combo_of_CG06-09_8_20_14_all_41_10]PIS33764.1 MAG: two-component system response regulator [Candidatus Omnitrophica bacterium CG08_land_8_20_14_0_20_41_16]